MIKASVSYPKEKIRIYLFEKISPAAKEAFEQSGYSVTEISKAGVGSELNEIISDAHIIGVRSRTLINKESLSHAKRLLSIGCFTVGTDQVELDEATSKGIAVFNAPHSSTRSVAELAIGCVISLARRLGDKNSAMHSGTWDKSAALCYEVRQKSIGIIGYGHIGQQVGLLAEALGMNVVFYDILKKLPLGRARAAKSLKELLEVSDFVTLHVPSTKSTKNLIGKEQLQKMKQGSYLLNLSRGEVVDLLSLRDAILSKHVAGAAVDVFPIEPASNAGEFTCELTGLDNVILTPHIGGSTEEAQSNIGREVALAIISYLDNGSTLGAVNFPQVHLPAYPGSHRILYVHQNQPGALSEVNHVISEVGANVDAQILSTYKDIGYLIMDINSQLSSEIKERISILPKAIKTRILY